MLRRRLPLIALVIGASLAQPTAQAPRQSAPFDRSRQFVPAELLVGFRPAPSMRLPASTRFTASRRGSGSIRATVVGDSDT